LHNGGGDAVANTEDVSNFKAAASVFKIALDSFEG